MTMNEQQAELIPTRPGARLRHQRETRGLTVKQISNQTMIRTRIIRAIENDDTDWIAPIYLRGYVRAYAKELNLDPDALEAETRATSSTDPELRSVFNIDPKRGFTERWLKAGGYLVASALVAALIWQVTQQAVQFSQGTTIIASEEGGPSDAGSVNTNNQPGSNSARQSTHLAASIASLEKLQDPPVDSGTAAQQGWSAINSPVEGLPTISVRVSADSWVEITDSSGKQLEKDLLRGGNERIYQGSPPFELMLGRPSAVELEFNGESVDLTPHIRGDVARLKLGAAEQPKP